MTSRCYGHIRNTLTKLRRAMQDSTSKAP
jgi:hypothetical protein